MNEKFSSSTKNQKQTNIVFACKQDVLWESGLEYVISTSGMS